MIKYEELKSILQKNRNISYPSVPKLYPNKRYCNLIYDNFGGEEGELTAITQYIYEHMNFKKEEAISHILQDIAIEEMHHLDILGEIITNLGEKPIYQNSNQKLWIANNVTYDICNLRDAIKKNMKDEESAIIGYRKLLRYTNNIHLRRIYERIILDETTHFEIFKRILMNLK
jgi:bacterioferritin